MRVGPALGWALRAGLVFLAVAPWVPELVQGLPGLDGLGRALEAWFRFQCERDPARSFAGVAVCVRCQGIYLGMGAGALFGRPRLRAPWHELWIGAGALAMVIDVASEALDIRPAWWPLRLATGLLLGYPAGVLLVRSLRARA